MAFIEVTRCRFFVQPHTHYLYEADINSQHIKEETCDIMHRRVDIGDNVNSRTWQDVTSPTWGAPILQPLNSGATISATFNHVNTTNTSSGTTVADTSFYGTSLLTPVFHSERVRLDPSVLGGNFYEGAPLPIPEGAEPIPEAPQIPSVRHDASTCFTCRELEQQVGETTEPPSPRSPNYYNEIRQLREQFNRRTLTDVTEPTTESSEELEEEIAEEEEEVELEP